VTARSEDAGRDRPLVDLTWPCIASTPDPGVLQDPRRPPLPRMPVLVDYSARRSIDPRPRRGISRSSGTRQQSYTVSPSSLGANVSLGNKVVRHAARRDRREVEIVGKRSREEGRYDHDRRRRHHLGRHTASSDWRLRTPGRAPPGQPRTAGGAAKSTRDVSQRPSYPRGSARKIAIAPSRNGSLTGTRSAYRVAIRAAGPLLPNGHQS